MYLDFLDTEHGTRIEFVDHHEKRCLIASFANETILIGKSPHCMLLTREMVQKLLPLIQTFAETGKLLVEEKV